MKIRIFVALVCTLLAFTAHAGHPKPQDPKQDQNQSQGQVQGQAQGQHQSQQADATAKATAAAVSVNHNDSKAVATGGHGGAGGEGGTATATQQQTATSNQTQTANNEGVSNNTTISTRVERSAPSVSAWSTIPTADCRKPYAVGGSAVTGSGLFSWTRPDKDCLHNAAINRAIAMGQYELAAELFCTSREIVSTIGTERCRELYIPPAPPVVESKDPETPTVLVLPQGVTRDEMNATIDRVVKALVAK